MDVDQIVCSDALEYARTLPDDSLNCIVTSPPYFGLRSYLPDEHPDKASEIGLEESPEAYVAKLVELFHELKRALRPDGTCWLNLGDSYANSNNAIDPYRITSSGKPMPPQGRAFVEGLPEKNLIGIPWRVAFALQADGWYLRSDIIWHKNNSMPESVTDRPSKAHEYVFLLTKSARYWYDAEAIKEQNTPDMQQRAAKGHTRGGRIDSRDQSRHDRESLVNQRSITSDGRNKRTVWSINTEPSSIPHYAMMPLKLAETCILAGCPETVCAVCGKAWERVVEREKSEKIDRSESYAVASGFKGNPQLFTRKSASGIDHGFAPTCACGGETRPGIVYDPFMGVGTTAYVARALKRSYLGTELDPKSIARANRRLRLPMKPDEAALLNTNFEELPMFAETPAPAQDLDTGDGRSKLI